MTDKTTIQLSRRTKNELDEIAAQGESYEGVLQRLIENYNQDEPLTEDRVRELIRDELRNSVLPEARIDR